MPGLARHGAALAFAALARRWFDAALGQHPVSAEIANLLDHLPHVAAADFGNGAGGPDWNQRASDIARDRIAPALLRFARVGADRHLPDEFLSHGRERVGDALSGGFDFGVTFPGRFGA